jgi:DNA-binding NtrC family response regulator
MAVSTRIKKNKTILVVDDDPENVRNYSEILRDLDYRVLARMDVDAALELLQGDTKVDLAITDYRMPGKTGLDFILALRKLRPILPVVMITAYGSIETYLRSISLGAFEFVNKPIKKKEFELIVEQALSGRNRKNPPGKDGHAQHSSH